MILADSAQEAQIHRDTYIAMLCAALRQHGAKALFAHQTGIISTVYLSYLTGKKGYRNLSPCKAEEIASLLPWPPEVRQRFVEHVILHREERLRKYEAFQSVAKDYTPAEVLTRIKEAFAGVMLEGNAAQSRLLYPAIRDDCIDFLRMMRPQQSSLDYADICLILCYVQGVLDRPDEALFYSKIASYILEMSDADDFRKDRACYDILRIDALRAEASAYFIMDLGEKSLETSDHALEQLHEVQTRPYLSEVNLYVTKIRALSKTPRFSIRVARQLATEARRAAEKLGSEQEYHTQRINIQRALGDAETQYGNAPKAGELLQPLVEQSATQTGVSLVLHVGVLRSYAHQQFKMGDLQGGRETLHTALRLASAAGLAHQIRQCRTQFGQIVDTLLSADCDHASA
jgi:hypothetical protein